MRKPNKLNISIRIKVSAQLNPLNSSISLSLKNIETFGFLELDTDKRRAFCSLGGPICKKIETLRPRGQYDKSLGLE